MERKVLGGGKVDAVGVHAPCRGEDRLDHRAVMLGHDRRGARDLELGCPFDGEGPQLIAESLELNVLQIVHATLQYFVEQRLHLRLGLGDGRCMGQMLGQYMSGYKILIML